MMTYRKIPWVIILCTLGIVLGYMCSHDVQTPSLHLHLHFPSFSFVLSHTLDFATQYIPFRLQTLQTRYGDVRSPNPRHAVEWDGVRVESNAPRFGW